MPFIGGGHIWIILLVLAVVLIVYGPGKLPEVGGAIGRGIREFRKASSDMADEIRQGTAQKAPADTSSTGSPASPAASSDVKPSTETKV